MNPLTSMFDFECRIETDKRYKNLAIYAHRTAGWNGESGLYESAKSWIDNWLKKDGKKDGSCDVMIKYLNFRMLEMKEFSEKVKNRRFDLIIPNYGPEFTPCNCGCSMLLNKYGDDAGVDPNYKPKNREGW